MTRILFFQSIYYIVTGASPLISMRFFEWVTGPKVDDWLVRMVGLLAVSIGITLLVAVRAKEITRAILILAITSALSFAAIDIFYSLTGRISMIYLLDAPLEIFFAFASLYLLKSKQKSL
jgi:4-amino-4-deoxy-L-arabinose transferase-like glycosyltransferase